MALLSRFSWREKFLSTLDMGGSILAGSVEVNSSRPVVFFLSLFFSYSNLYPRELLVNPSRGIVNVTMLLRPFHAHHTSCVALGPTCRRIYLVSKVCCAYS